MWDKTSPKTKGVSVDFQNKIHCLHSIWYFTAFCTWPQNPQMHLCFTTVPPPIWQPLFGVFWFHWKFSWNGKFCGSIYRNYNLLNHVIMHECARSCASMWLQEPGGAAARPRLWELPDGIGCSTAMVEQRRGGDVGSGSEGWRIADTICCMAIVLTRQ